MIETSILHSSVSLIPTTQIESCTSTSPATFQFINKLHDLSGIPIVGYVPQCYTDSPLNNKIYTLSPSLFSIHPSLFYIYLLALSHTYHAANFMYTPLCHDLLEARSIDFVQLKVPKEDTRGGERREENNLFVFSSSSNCSVGNNQSTYSYVHTPSGRRGCKANLRQQCMSARAEVSRRHPLRLFFFPFSFLSLSYIYKRGSTRELLGRGTELQQQLSAVSWRTSPLIAERHKGCFLPPSLPCSPHSFCFVLFILYSLY